MVEEANGSFCLAFLFGFGVLVLAGGATAAASPNPVSIRCSNPHSGATWEVVIDYDRSLADSFPAEITASHISWHDTLRGGYYSLDRASGKLTMVNGSSTGGYFLHNQCQVPEPADRQSSR